MNAYWFNLVLISVLILANAVFAGSEMALVSLREGQLRSLERHDGPAVRAIGRLVRDPNRFLATIQIAIAMAGYLASATAAVALAEPLVPFLGFLGGAAEPVSVALVTLAVVFVSLVAGELAPKRLAMQHPQGWAIRVARPLDALAAVARPALWVLGRATNGIVRVFGGDPRAAKEPISLEEIRDLVLRHRGLTPEQRTMITGALEIEDRLVRQVLIHRSRVFSLPADTPGEQARGLLVGSGHSQAPVVQSHGLDDVVGVVHLLGEHGTAADAASAPMVVPDGMRISDALRRFRTERQQFAIVVDENGTVDGIVTVEDLLEEVVGEIYDEADLEVLPVTAGPDGSLALPGSFPVHDLPDIGVAIDDAPRGDYVTVAGLALAALGRVPQEPGECIEFASWTLHVTQTEHHAITEVRLTPRRKAP